MEKCKTLILNFCPVLCNRVTPEECMSEGKNKGKTFSRNHAFYWQETQKNTLQDLRAFLSQRVRAGDQEEEAVGC